MAQSSTRTLAQRATDARRSLDALGRRRRALDEAEEKWKNDARRVLEKGNGAVPKTESAERLGVHRTTVYELLG